MKIMFKEFQEMFQAMTEKITLLDTKIEARNVTSCSSKAPHELSQLVSFSS